MAKILIVDDEPSLRFVVRRMLEYAGYDVAEAGDAKESFAMLKENSIDLVLMDVIMPYVSGWDATKIIKSDGKMHAVPIVILTARTDEINKDEKMKYSGADAWLEKPIVREDLLATVDLLLKNNYFHK